MRNFVGICVWQQHSKYDDMTGCARARVVCVSVPARRKRTPVCVYLCAFHSERDDWPSQLGAVFSQSNGSAQNAGVFGCDDDQRRHHLEHTD